MPRSSSPSPSSSSAARYHGGKTQWVLDADRDWLGPAFADWSLADTLPSVRCPLLAIHGSEDEYGSDVHPDMFTRRPAGRRRWS